MVTSPSTPPYSSITSAMWIRSVCIFCSSTPSRHRRRRVEQRPQQLLQVEAPPPAPKPCCSAKSLRMDQAQRLVERALVDRQPREAVFAEDLDQVVLADVDRHRHDLGLGHAPRRRPACGAGCRGRAAGAPRRWARPRRALSPARSAVGLKAERRREEVASGRVSAAGRPSLRQRALRRARRPVAATAHLSFVQNDARPGVLRRQYGSETPSLQVSVPRSPPSASASASST